MQFFSGAGSSSFRCLNAKNKNTLTGLLEAMCNDVHHLLQVWQHCTSHKDGNLLHLGFRWNRKNVKPPAKSWDLIGLPIYTKNIQKLLRDLKPYETEVARQGSTWHWDPDNLNSRMSGLPTLFRLTHLADSPEAMLPLWKFPPDGKWSDFGPRKSIFLAQKIHQTTNVISHPKPFSSKISSQHPNKQALLQKMLHLKLHFASGSQNFHPQGPSHHFPHRPQEEQQGRDAQGRGHHGKGPGRGVAHVPSAPVWKRWKGRNGSKKRPFWCPKKNVVFLGEKQTGWKNMNVFCEIVGWLLFKQKNRLEGCETAYLPMICGWC